MTLKELQKQLSKLNDNVLDIIEKSKYNDNENLSELDDYKDNLSNPNELQRIDEYSAILYRLQDISDTIERLDKPTKEEGYLVKLENGRYELNGRELTSGFGLEWLCDYDDMYYNSDADTCYPYWRKGRLEHNGNDYYIVGCHVQDMTTVKIRLK